MSKSVSECGSDNPPRSPAENAATGPALAVGLLALVAGAKLLVHLLLATRYGYFRDELYYLACGRHLDWGYVDCAPMIGWVARVALLFGGALPVLRAFSALAGALMVALTILITWRLGGSRLAQGLAGLSVLLVPIYLGLDSILTMNAFEPVFWMGCIYVLIRLIQTGNSRLWVGFGVLAGLGLMNKHSTAFFGVAAVIGLLLTGQRKEFAKPWIWLGGAIALLIFSPNLIWQIRNHFPTVEDLHNVRVTGKNVVLPPLQFIVQQILVLHPVLCVVWLAGLGHFLFGAGKRFRVLGWTFVAFFLMMMLLHGKDYYLAPIYPMLFAGGAVAWESALEKWPYTQGRMWPRAAVLGVVAATGAVLAPLTLPLLSPENYVAYSQKVGFQPAKQEVHHQSLLPQLFSDQFGWPELVQQVAQIYNALPPEQRSKTAILAGNYGEAGAIDLFGPPYGLPSAISGHQTYFFWGPRQYTGEVIIALQRRRKGLEETFTSVEEAGVHYHKWGMAEENAPIYICRGLKRPLAEVWPSVKHWN